MGMCERNFWLRCSFHVSGDFLLQGLVGTGGSTVGQHSGRPRPSPLRLMAIHRCFASDQASVSRAIVLVRGLHFDTLNKLMGRDTLVDELTHCQAYLMAPLCS